MVLDGAKSLAVPTSFGQDLEIHAVEEPQLVWGSFTEQGRCWFEAVFDVPKLRLKNATFSSSQEGSAEFIAETLQTILQEARKLNPSFLNQTSGVMVKTHLTFPRDWGLGSSSTLLANIANWAGIDAYQLLWNAFSGSGYDIACAQSQSPLLYQLINKEPQVTSVTYAPSFADQLFFVHLNQKQNSREGIAHYKQQRHLMNNAIEEISQLSDAFLHASSMKDLEKVMNEHEQLISSMVKLTKVKDLYFKDYFGAVKSLGAWGGDFMLATGNEDAPNYFKDKGFETIIPYNEMVL